MPLVPASRAVRGLLAGVASPLAALGLFAPTGALAQQPFDVALRDGLLSIRANDASVSELAAALAKETGVNFVVTGDAAATITTEIVDEPFAKAVERLSPNHLLMRDGQDHDSAVTEVVLMLDDGDAVGGSGDGGGFLPSGAPADEIVSGEQPPPADALPADALPTDALPTDAPPADAPPTEEMPTNEMPSGDAPDGIAPESLDQGAFPDGGQAPQ